jgi:hypothetical protein
MLRRALMTRVPVAAFHECRIFENSTATSDEVVAHRLGQLALIGRPSAKLDVRGLDCVLARDLRCEGGAVADLDVDLALAEGGGVLRLAVASRLGTVAESKHAKFSAVASVGFFPHFCLPAVGKPALEALRAAGLELKRRPGSRGWFCPPQAQRARVEEVLRAAGEEPLFLESEDFDVAVEPLGQHPAQECLRLAVEALLSEMQAFARCLTSGETTECSSLDSAAALAKA